MSRVKHYPLLCAAILAYAFSQTLYTAIEKWENGLFWNITPKRRQFCERKSPSAVFSTTWRFWCGPTWA